MEGAYRSANQLQVGAGKSPIRWVLDRNGHAGPDYGTLSKSSSTTVTASFEGTSRILYVVGCC